MKSVENENTPGRKDSFLRRQFASHKRSLSDGYNTTLELFAKEQRQYNLFHTRAPKNILAILDLHDDEVL